MNKFARGVTASGVAIMVGLIMGGPLHAYADGGNDNTDNDGYYAFGSAEESAQAHKQRDKFAGGLGGLKPGAEGQYEYFTDGPFSPSEYDKKPSPTQAVASRVGSDNHELSASVGVFHGMEGRENVTVRTFPTLSKVVDPVNKQTVLAYGIDASYGSQTPDLSMNVYDITKFADLNEALKVDQGVLWILKNTYPQKSIEEMKAAGLPTGSEQQTIAGIQAAIWKRTLKSGVTLTAMAPKVQALYDALNAKVASMTTPLTDADVTSGVGRVYQHHGYRWASGAEGMPLIAAKVVETTAETGVKPDEKPVTPAEKPVKPVEKPTAAGMQPEAKPSVLTKKRVETKPVQESSAGTAARAEELKEIINTVANPVQARRALADTGHVG